MKSQARARTVAHMQRLVATATAASAAASCSHETDVKTVTITPPPAPTGTDIAIASPPPPPPTTTIPAPPPPPAPPPDPSGYLVVDMLPAPARCLGVAAAAHATGSFRHEAGTLVLDLDVVLGANATFSGAAPTAWSASVVRSSFRANNTVAVVRLKPPSNVPGTHVISLQIPVDCGGGAQGTLSVTATYTAPAQDGVVPTYALHDF